jgi:hypothetical protein
MPDPTPAQAPAQASSQPAAPAQHQPNPAPASAPDPAMVGTPTPAQPARPAVAPTGGLPTPPVPPPAPPKPPTQPRPSEEPEKPQSLSQKLADIHDRVETAANSRVFAGKAEAFADAWADLDDIGDPDPNKPAEAAQIQAAHNHLQHHAPRRASEIDSLEQQLDAATSDKPRPQAVPDSPQLASVKARIAALQTDLARDPRALPSDKERAQQLQERVDEINAEKATAGAR